jgi:TetR/AcrR family transcriptional regulator
VSGGRRSFSQRGGRAHTAKGAKPAKAEAGVAPTGVAPIYKRLPHGPHRLARNEVVRHQRARIHGAMVEAVARNGYERTSVKQVIGLAGVSRRSFYEQFANKEGCFLATFDMIALRELRRISKAYRAADGGLEERLRAVFERIAEQAQDSRKASTLVLVEAETAGTGGTLRLRKAAATCEHLLSRSFLESPEAVPLPTPVVRGITGGLHGAMSSALRAGRLGEGPVMAQEMLRWTLLFQTPKASRMQEPMAACVSRRMREVSLASAHRRGPERAPAGDERERLLHQVLRLAALGDYRELSAPQIADEARVPIDAFLELFANRDECFLAALEMVAGEILAIASSPDLISSDWPRAVRRVLRELMGYLGDRPLYSRTIAQEAFFAGPEAVEQTLELAHGIATLLTEGAPGRAQSALAVEAIAGALLHTVRCQVTSGRVQLLGPLSDYLAYVVLTPFIGAEQAIEIVTEESER